MSYPFFVGFQKLSALHQSLGMRINVFDFRQRSSRKTYQGMLTGDNLFPYDHMVIPDQQIIIILDNACSGVFYRQHCIISAVIFNCFFFFCLKFFVCTKTLVSITLINKHLSIFWVNIKPLRLIIRAIRAANIGTFIPI